MEPAILLLLSLLTPWEIPGVNKIRLGPNHDGGYVILDYQLEKIEAVFSYGVGTTWDFELELADYTGAVISMYDHTINQVDTGHPLVTHYREGVAAVNLPPFKTIADHVGSLVGHRLFLKMDIEGAEYETLGTSPDEIIRSFDQIVMEVHWINHPTVKSLQLLSRLNRTHALVHIHGTNCCGGFDVPGLEGPVPNLVELTWIKRDIVDNIVPNTQTYPTRLDSRILPDRPEININFPPFSARKSLHNEL